MLIMQLPILKVYMYHSKVLHKVYFIPCHKKYRNNTITVTYMQHMMERLGEKASRIQWLSSVF